MKDNTGTDQSFDESYQWHLRRLNNKKSDALEVLEFYEPSRENLAHPLRFVSRLYRLRKCPADAGEYRAALDALHRDPRGVQDLAGMVEKTFCDAASRFKDTPLEDLASAMMDAANPYRRDMTDFTPEEYDPCLRELQPDMKGRPTEWIETFLDRFKVLCNIGDLRSVAKRRVHRDSSARQRAWYDIANSELARRRHVQRLVDEQRAQARRDYEDEMSVTVNVMGILHLLEDIHERLVKYR